MKEIVKNNIDTGLKTGEFEINSPSSISQINIFLIRKYFQEYLEGIGIGKKREIQKKGNLIASFIEDFLKQNNLKISDIKSVKIVEGGNMILDTGKDTFSFDLYAETQENFYKGDEQKIYAENFKLSEKMVKISEDLDMAVDAMDYIFDQNEKEWFGELNDKDVLLSDKFGKYLQGYNLNEIAEIVKKGFDSFDNISNRFNGKHEATKKVLKTKERFLNMLMGIGNKYEGAAEYMKKTSDETILSKIEKPDSLLSDIVEGKSVNELLIYLKYINKEIDKNDYQSTPVEQSYKVFTENLNNNIFEKFKKVGANEKQFLEFAKIISGKNEDYRPKWMGGEAGVDDNLSSSSETMKVLNDIILHLMMKEGGIMDKVNKSNLSKIEDEKIGNKDTYKIVDDFKNILINKVGIKGNNEINSFIGKFGYLDILNITQGQKYSELTFEQKAKISVIYRVIEKINNKAPEGGIIYDESMVFTNYKYSGGYYGGKDKLSLGELSNVFSSVAINASEEMVENMTDVFQKSDSLGEYLWGKEAKDFGLIDKNDIEIFDFFKDFQGIGALDFSDRSISNLKTTGKFAAVIATAMAIVPIAGLGVASAATQGAVMGASATLGSIAVNPKGYDTLGEAITDVSTDFLIGTLTGGLGGKFVQLKGVEYYQYSSGKRVLLTPEFKNKILRRINNPLISPAKYPEKGFMVNKFIFASDLMFLGIIPEAGRMMSVDWYFHKEGIFTENKLDK